MKLLIIRHGEPCWGKDALTEKGKREAELLKDRLVQTPIDFFFCSPLTRAKETAAPTLKALGREAEICDWLREFPGKITGENDYPWDRMPAQLNGDDAYYDKDHWIDTPLYRSESIRNAYAAACEGLDALLARHGYVHEGKIFRVTQANNDTLAFFCHFGLECVLLSHLLSLSPVALWHGFVALPSSVTVLATEERENGIAAFRCNRFGDLSHLYVAGEEPSFHARFCETYANENERH